MYDKSAKATSTIFEHYIPVKNKNCFRRLCVSLTKVKGEATRVVEVHNKRPPSVR